MACTHLHFRAAVDVHRLLAEDQDGRVIGYAAEVRIECLECGVPFQFLGIPGMGLSPTEPMVSPDCTELRVPIAPRGEYFKGIGVPGFRIHRRE